MRTVVVILSLFAIVSCEEAATTDDGEGVQSVRKAVTAPSDEIFYNEIKAGSFALYRDISLCELVSRSGAAGVYEVTELRGVTEEVPGRPGKLEAATYVKLELKQEWSTDAPENPIVRIDGGPLFHEDVTEMWEISLKLGEEIGAFFEPASARNHGFVDLRGFRLFRRAPHGGFSNGQLFTQTAVDSVQMAEWVRDIKADLPACAIEKVPDRP